MILFLFSLLIQSTISAARFIVAVGGRPTPLECPGGELAISSDDLFSLGSCHKFTLAQYNAMW